MDPRNERRRADSLGVAGAWTLLTAVVPAAGLVRTGRRRRGVALVVLTLLLALALVLLVLARREWVLALAVDPLLLRVAGVLVALAGLFWVWAITTTFRRLRPAPRSSWQRVAGFLLVGLLSFAIAAPTAVGARYAWSQADLVRSVFGANSRGQTTTPSRLPAEWKDQGRLNVLLLGGDSADDRIGLRTDTVMVASVDTTTGDTVLFGLPRNTARMPFPEGPLAERYPYGWYDGWNPDNPEYFLNSMYDYVPAANPDLFPETTHAGGEVMKASVGEALGLPIDYYAVVDLAGFERLINALGGVTVNINTYVAMGGSTDAGRPPEQWLSPGPEQHLDGNQALWYARGRFGSDDYERMARQRCVMNALADQANIPTLVGRYEAIAREFQSVVLTDVPQDDLPAVLDLVLMMRQGNMRSIVFTHGEAGFWSSSPDFDLIREQVRQAIEESHQAPPSPDPTPEAVTEERAEEEPAPATSAAPVEDQPLEEETTGPSPSPTPTTASEDVRDACAYDPVKAQEALDNPPYWVR